MHIAMVTADDSPPEYVSHLDAPDSQVLPLCGHSHREGAPSNGVFATPRQQARRALQLPSPQTWAGDRPDVVHAFSSSSAMVSRTIVASSRGASICARQGVAASSNSVVPCAVDERNIRSCEFSRRWWPATALTELVRCSSILVRAGHRAGDGGGRDRSAGRVARCAARLGRARARPGHHGTEAGTRHRPWRQLPPRRHRRGRRHGAPRHRGGGDRRRQRSARCMRISNTCGIVVSPGSPADGGPYNC